MPRTIWFFFGLWFSCRVRWLGNLERVQLSDYCRKVRRSRKVSTCFTGTASARFARADEIQMRSWKSDDAICCSAVGWNAPRIRTPFSVYFAALGAYGEGSREAL